MLPGSESESEPGSGSGSELESDPIETISNGDHE
jgi:hypothetical protein